MKQLLFFFLFLTFSVTAQDFSLVDTKVKTYPKLLTAEKLADKINSDFSSETEKVRAIYTWLTSNIRYDLAEYYNPTQTSYSFSYSTEEEKLQKIKALDTKIVTETLSNRKAVCEGYARVFAKICNLLTIENAFISGYAKTTPDEIGKPKRNPNHAWNAVKIDGIWKYFDATWGAGYEESGTWKRNFNDYFFNIPKKKLFLTHFPEKTLWQLRVKRMNKEQFYNQPLFTHSFLKSNLELVSPISGIIKRKIDNSIEIQLKNLQPHQKVFVGFNGYKVVKIPSLSFKDTVGTVKIIPPENANQLYLIVDGNVVLEFLLQ